VRVLRLRLLPCFAHELGIDDFCYERRNDLETLGFSRRIKAITEGNLDQNALTPIMVRLRDSRELSRTIATVYGNIISREAHLAKFHRDLASATASS